MRCWEELARDGRLVALLQGHTQLVMITMAQLILCNRIHRLDQRAARWLLQVDDRVDEAPFEVTQEFLAQMIGVQRPALSVAMRQFKDAGLVRYARGQITIADREGLLERSCGCTTSSRPRLGGSMRYLHARTTTRSRCPRT